MHYFDVTEERRDILDNIPDATEMERSSSSC